MKNGKILGGSYFFRFLQTVYQIDANDMALESYGKHEKKLYRKFFLILYGFKTNLNTIKSSFEYEFFYKFVGIGKIIYRWKEGEKCDTVHVESFLKFSKV